MDEGKVRLGQVRVRVRLRVRLGSYLGSYQRVCYRRLCSALTSLPYGTCDEMVMVKVRVRVKVRLPDRPR